MADNYVTNPGSGGSTFRAESLSSVLYPVVKRYVGIEDVVAQNGWTPGRLISAATTNATSVTTQATLLGVLIVTSVAASVRWLKLYNKASAPTVGTDTPIWTLPVPIISSSAGGIAVPLGDGLRFTTGFAFAITANYADTDTTAIAAGDVFLAYGYA